MTTVMWSETVVLGKDRSHQTKKNRSWSWYCTVHAAVLVYSLGLAGLVLCTCETRSCYTLVVIMILKDTAAIQVLFIVSLFCAWNITTVEINNGVHLLKS